MTRRVATVAAMLALLSVWTYARPRATEIAAPDFGGSLPLIFGEWVGRDAPPLDPDVAKTLGATQYVHRYYGPRTAGSAQPAADRQRADGSGERTAENGERRTESGRRIEMDIAYYARPEAGAAMHSPLSCLPGNGWQVLESRVTPVTLERTSVDVRRLVVGRGADRVAMTYWFQNRGAVVGNEYRQRLQLLTSGLKGRPTDAALVRVMSLDTREGHESLATFTRDLATFLTRRFQ